jgi:hypothetical protein
MRGKRPQLPLKIDIPADYPLMLGNHLLNDLEAADHDSAVNLEPRRMDAKKENA